MMLQRLLAGLVSAVALVALGGGCAEPSARITPPSSGPVATAPAPASEVSGIWRGTFGQVAASLYLDEGNCILEIKEDGTFTATATPSKARTNNLSKAWTWSGTAIRSGNRVTLRSSQGPSAIRIRSGNTLYGVAEDPTIGATIMMSLEQDT